MRLDDRERHRPGAELLQSLGRRDLFSEGDGPAKPDNQFNRQTIGLPAFHDPTPYWESAMMTVTCAHPHRHASHRGAAPLNKESTPKREPTYRRAELE
jgi:hypothetical protein